MGIPYLVYILSYTILLPTAKPFGGSLLVSVVYVVIPVLDLVCYCAMIVLSRSRLIAELRGAGPRNLGDSMSELSQTCRMAIEKARAWRSV